jgi:hypothetical protein
MHAARGGESGMAKPRCEIGIPGESEIRGLLDRANQGDSESLPQLRAVLDAHPEIWQAATDLAGHAEDAQIALAAGENMLLRDALERKLDELKVELGRESAPPLERLLIDRIVMCWLQSWYADGVIAQARDMDLRQAAFIQDRANRAHRRFLAAIKQLAIHRKLLPGSPPHRFRRPSPKPPANTNA